VIRSSVQRVILSGVVPFVALPLLSGPAGAAGAAQVPSEVVYGAGASGAVIGVTLRIPAASAGGIGYADSQVDLNNARARSSSLYPGFLVDAFFKSSCNCAYNPTDTIAQNPPSSSAPEKSEWQGNQATPAGEQLTLVAETPSVLEAGSRLVSGQLRAPSAPITVDGGRVQTSSLVEPDGTVVTEVTSQAKGIEIADMVTISQATSVAKTTTAPGEEPEMTVTTKIGSVLVNGIRSELSEQGLVLGDRSVVTAGQLASFNTTLKALQERGIYVSAAEPVVQTLRPGFGEVLAGAVRIRYQAKQNPTPNDVGTDNDFLIASVGNLASSQRRVHPEPGGPVSLPDADHPVTSDQVSAPLPASADGTAFASFDSTSAPSDVDAASPVVATATQASSTDAQGDAESDSLVDLLANSKKAGAAPKVVSLYGWLLAVAVLSAALPARILARQRTT
jgi:hypothetical protein